MQRKRLYKKLEYNMTIHDVEENKIVEVKEILKKQKRKKIHHLDHL